MTRIFKKTWLAILLVVSVLMAGYLSRGVPLAFAASVSNYFLQPTGGGQNNKFYLNGSWYVDSLEVTSDGTELSLLDGVPGTLDYFPGAAVYTTSFSVAASVCEDSAGITATGAALGDFCVVAPDATAAALNWDIDCYVSATNEAKIHICNATATGINVASGNYYVRVLDR